jgi:hypothetical protein
MAIAAIAALAAPNVLAAPNPAPAGSGASCYSSLVFPSTQTLNAFIESINSNGTVMVNGGDTQQPTTPFQFAWGDGSTTSGFFPQTHIYTNVLINYVISITATENSGATQQFSLAVLFTAPVITPQSLPGVSFQIPSTSVTFQSHWPGYTPPTDVTYFSNSSFPVYSSSDMAYILAAISSIDYNFANNNSFLLNGVFSIDMLEVTDFDGGASYWFTTPMSVGFSSDVVAPPMWYILFNEIGKDTTLDTPVSFTYGGNTDGNASEIYSETMGDIFSYASGCQLISNAASYGLGPDVAFDVQNSMLAGAANLQGQYNSYVAAGAPFSSWNPHNGGTDPTLGTVATLAWVFIQQAETQGQGYQIPTTRLMTFLQQFNASLQASYAPASNTPAGATFRSTLMVGALSYAFSEDLRSEFESLNFPIDNGIFDQLFEGVTGGGASLAPPTGTFAAQTVGSTSAGQAFTLTNYLLSPITLSASFSGANPKDFPVQASSTCPYPTGTLAASSICTYVVAFAPSVNGAESSTLSVSDTDGIQALASSPQILSLTGTGEAPLVSLSATSLTFSPQNLSKVSAPQTVTLTNSGTAALSVTSIALGGTNGVNFSETNNCGASVAAGAYCTITVTFTPTAIGPYTATLTITDNNNGVPGSTQTVSLSGTGINPGASLSATSEAFGSQVINTTSAAKTLTLTSNGTTSLGLASITIAGTNSGDFHETNNCPATLAVAAKCTITLTYTPSVLGAETASLSVADNASSSPQTVALTGTGVVPAYLSATSLAFGNVGENSPSAGKAVSIYNNEAVALTISSITTGNPDFTETNTCNGSVPAKGHCVITVTFTPSTLTAETGTLTVNDTAPNSPQTAALTGTGVLPAKFSATSLAFGSVPQSTASAAKTITFYNEEAEALTISSITTGNPDFAETNTCGGSVPAAGNCVITVTFTPSMIGAETGTLTVTDAASNSPQTAALTGTGIAQATVSPTSIAFAAQTAGTTSAAKTVTLTNNLSTAITFSGVTFGGTNPTDFASPTNACGTSLAGKAHCTISVTFKPGATGARSGTMNVNDSANDTPQTVTLTGTGK